MLQGTKPFKISVMDREVVTIIHVYPPNEKLAEALQRHGLTIQAHEDLSSLFRLLETGPGVAILGNSDSGLEAIPSFRLREPDWYKTPIILFAPANLQNDPALSNVTWLDADASELALVSACHSALRDRHLQLELHETIERFSQQTQRTEEEFQQFVYAASHDLKEPLRMVSGYLQLLEKRYAKVLDQEAGEFIELAVDGANRMSRLISDLLAYSRVGTRPARVELVNGDDVLLWLRMNLQKLFEESNAQLTHDPLPSVVFDQGELLQIFELLIGNALKFGSGSPDLHIHIAAESRSAEWVFSVSDNGPGFDPQHSERIFGVFKRLVGRDIPGTGMGLALAKRIVEKHGGRIWATSQPGQGATFWFTVRNAALAAAP